MWRYPIPGRSAIQLCQRLSLSEMSPGERGSHGQLVRVVAKPIPLVAGQPHAIRVVSTREARLLQPMRNSAVLPARRRADGNRAHHVIARRAGGGPTHSGNLALRAGALGAGEPADRALLAWEFGAAHKCHL